MIEIPEAAVLSDQINEVLVGKVVRNVIVNQSPHKFAWLSGDSKHYEALLCGKKVEKAVHYGGKLEMQIESARVLFCEGIVLRYIDVNEKLPKKHQLMIEFEDDTFITATVQMYGGMYCFKEGTFDNQYHLVAKERPSPLLPEFDEVYFDKLISHVAVQRLSAKAFLATEQRIPGLGNGVLQDILHNAKIHPKRKVETFSDEEKDMLYHSIKSTLLDMTLKGGRDTEKDLFGCYGGYRTKVSKKTVGKPCDICGGNIVKKAYLGGSIYYCESCQLEK